MPDADLDTRIRELVARAVADAPPAPEIDPDTVTLEAPTTDRRRWWVGGGVAALVAAAAAIVAFVVVDPTDDAVSTPATVPTTTPTAPTVEPTPTAPEPTPPPTNPPVTIPPTTTAEEPAVPGDDVVLTAGQEGVIERRGNDVRVLTDGPTLIALATPDGRVLVQQPTGEGVDDEPRVLNPDDGTTTPLLPGANWDGLVVMHDVELVGDRQLLLVSILTGTDDPSASTEAIYVIDLATGERTELPAGGVAVMDRLTLAPNGLVVGGVARDNAVAFLALAVPGSPAASAPVPTAADLGLADGYPNCDLDCPRMYTVLADGRTFAWLAADNGAVVVRSLDDADETSTPLPFSPQGSGLDATAEGEFLLARSAPDVRAMLLRPDGSTLELDGAIATAGPAGVATVPATPPTTPTTPTSTPSVQPAGLPRVLVAGDDGVVEVVDGQTRTLTTEPMVIALDAGDGRIITQRRAGQAGEVGPGEPNWTEADTAPLELLADGTLRPLFEGEWEAATVLHDVEVVNGRRLLLYSTQTPVVPQEANEDLYVVDLATGERSLVANGIGGWEFGTDRLHLATTGLVVGQMGNGPSVSPVFLPVPSPFGNGDFPTAAEVGLEEQYVDCECPSAFTISADGSTLAWRAGEPTVFATALGDASGASAVPEAEPLVTIPDGFVSDLDLDDRAVVVSFFNFEGEQPAVLVPLDGSAPIVLPGLVATLPPAG